MLTIIKLLNNFKFQIQIFLMPFFRALPYSVCCGLHLTECNYISFFSIGLCCVAFLRLFKRNSIFLISFNGQKLKYLAFYV